MTRDDVVWQASHAAALCVLDETTASACLVSTRVAQASSPHTTRSRPESLPEPAALAHLDLRPSLTSCPFCAAFPPLSLISFSSLSPVQILPRVSELRVGPLERDEAVALLLRAGKVHPALVRRAWRAPSLAAVGSCGGV